MRRDPEPAPGRASLTPTCRSTGHGRTRSEDLPLCYSAVSLLPRLLRPGGAGLTPLDNVSPAPIRIAGQPYRWLTVSALSQPDVVALRSEGHSSRNGGVQS